MGRQRLCRFFVERECERECLDRSLSNGIGFTSSKGCPFTPFTFTIQPIKRRHSAARFCTLRWCIPKLLSSRFSLASGVRDPLALVGQLLSSPSPPIVHNQPCPNPNMF